MDKMPPNKALQRTAAPLLRSTVAGIRERVVRSIVSVGRLSLSFCRRATMEAHTLPAGQASADWGDKCMGRICPKSFQIRWLRVRECVWKVVQPA